MNGRTRDRAVRAEYTAITWIWLENRPATFAIIEVLTRVRRHLFKRLVTAFRACDFGLKNETVHLRRLSQPLTPYGKEFGAALLFQLSSIHTRKFLESLFYRNARIKDHFHRVPVRAANRLFNNRVDDFDFK